MATTFKVISLGQQALVDTTGGNTLAESADRLNGKTFGSDTNPLFKNAQTFSPASPGAGASTPFDVYNQNADGGTAIEYFNVDGVRHAFDAAVIYNATITFRDGSQQNITAVIFQDWNGATYWAPERTLDTEGQTAANVDQAAMNSKAIESLTLNSVFSSNRSGLEADRQIWNIVCFNRGTMITSAADTCPVEDLQVGDMILTKDNGLQPIRWIGSRKIGAEILNAYPKLRPIRIKAGALGADAPTHDLVVSPQHRILVRSKIALRMFGTNEVLVAAKQLLGVNGVEIAQDLSEVEYFHFMFDTHEIVLANGAEVESLFTGPEAQKAIGAAAWDEIQALFPDLAAAGSGYEPAPARPLIKGRLGRQLAERHMRNDRQIVG